MSKEEYIAMIEQVLMVSDIGVYGVRLKDEDTVVVLFGEQYGYHWHKIINIACTSKLFILAKIVDTIME